MRDIRSSAQPAPFMSVEAPQAAPDILSYTEKALVRISTAGSVDDGKSTLLGRLLLETESVPTDVVDGVRGKPGSEDTPERIALALLTDGLRAEQEQGITIDVAYRYFTTQKRRFILADSPGHEQYTRNMATGASTADAALLLVDASKGVLTQTKRHAFIADLLGVPRFLVAVNKMDLVKFDQDVFNRIRDDFSDYAAKLNVKEVRFVPVSALLGDNITTRSERMPWYQGESILEYFDNVYVAGDRNLVDFRLPVQGVLRGFGTFRGLMGQIASGGVRVGEEIVLLPSHKRSRVKSIYLPARGAMVSEVTEAQTPQSVLVTLEDELDASRGSYVVRPHNVPQGVKELESVIVWLSEEPMMTSKHYIIQHTTRDTKAIIRHVRYVFDVGNLSRISRAEVQLNDIARVKISLADPLFVDPYRRNRATGNFILVDPNSGNTVAAGMVLDVQEDSGVGDGQERGSKEELHEEVSRVSRRAREAAFGFKASTVWLTGLSGSGKSTIAKVLEERLFNDGRPVFLLDGDNVRRGLCRGLAFGPDGRTENLRRVAEVARLFNEAGVSVICSFISPSEEHRTMARTIIGDESFIEVYVSTPLEVCESRDPHGLYSKARRGEIQEFTGVSAPYERPGNARVEINTATSSVEDAVAAVVAVLT